MRWFTLVIDLVVSDIIAIINSNKRQKQLDRFLNRWSNCEKPTKAVLDDVTWRGNLKQGTQVMKLVIFNKKGGMYVQNWWSMVVRPKKHNYMK